MSLNHFYPQDLNIRYESLPSIDLSAFEARTTRCPLILNDLLDPLPANDEKIEKRSIHPPQTQDGPMI
jgi:hypothetical protein